VHCVFRGGIIPGRTFGPWHFDPSPQPSPSIGRGSFFRSGEEEDN
jgi:hypothetical protein